jgi:membrane protein implicated in regulation of membrane protease activity
VDGPTLIFLVIGAVGAVVLGLALLGAGILHVAHVDLGGPASVESIAGFLGAFGFGGAIASELLHARTPLGIAAAAGAGLAAAVPTAYLAVRLSRWARDIQTDPTLTRLDLIGTIGVVVTPIPASGYGEVRVRVAGLPVKLNARADHPIPYGTEVFVIEAPSDTSVIVEPTLPLG